MLKRISMFLDTWNPWRLRKRIKELDESLERILEVRDETIESVRSLALKENERLKEENERLEAKNKQLTSELALCTCNDEDEDGWDDDDWDDDDDSDEWGEWCKLCDKPYFYCPCDTEEEEEDEWEEDE